MFSGPTRLCRQIINQPAFSSVSHLLSTLFLLCVQVPVCVSEMTPLCTKFQINSHTPPFFFLYRQCVFEAASTPPLMFLLAVSQTPD